MKTEPAGEFFGMHYSPGPEGMSIQGAVALWGWSVLHILEGLRADLEPVQVRIAQDILMYWGEAMPGSLVPPDVPRVVLMSEVPETCELFEEARTLAALVRIFRPLFAHADENRERDERIVEELQAFCDRITAEMRSLSSQGDLTVGPQPYAMLASHLRQLLYLVLGDRVMERFISRYDETMERLEQTARLAAAPKV